MDLEARQKKGCVSNLPEGCKATNIGTYNVQVVHKVLKLQNLLMEMTHINLNIIGVSETHWTKDTSEAF